MMCDHYSDLEFTVVLGDTVTADSWSIVANLAHTVETHKQ